MLALGSTLLALSHQENDAPAGAMTWMDDLEEATELAEETDRTSLRRLSLRGPKGLSVLRRAGCPTHKKLRELYEEFVCVRITDMRGVDLRRTPFDFDLTFAVVLMHPDGHVYHRYGGRDERSADVWLSFESLERLLRSTLREHEAYSRSPSPPTALPPLRIEELESFKKRDKGECIHCHSVFPGCTRTRAVALPGPRTIVGSIHRQGESGSISIGTIRGLSAKCVPIPLPRVVALEPKTGRDGAPADPSRGANPRVAAARLALDATVRSKRNPTSAQLPGTNAENEAAVSDPPCAGGVRDAGGR